MPETGWVGIDLGTGSVKAAVVTDAGAVLAQATRGYAVASPHAGWAQSDPAEWLSAASEAAAQAIDESGAQILGVGFSGQMHGVVLADDAGTPLRPAILWADSRSAAQVQRMAAHFDQDHLARLGSGAVAGFAATSLAWLGEHEPAMLQQAAMVLQPKDWLRQALGGACATDPSDASGTLLADVATGQWDAPALTWAGVPGEVLPPIIDSCSAAGTVRISRPTGDPAGDLAEIPAVVGGADTACALAGLGLRPGEAFIAVGTGSQIVSVLDGPAVDPTLRTHTFCGVGPCGSSWYRIGAVQNAGLALEVALRWLGASAAEAHAALAGGVRPDDPVFVPTLSGERTPDMDPGLTGSWQGLRLSTDRAAMLRSVLEGIAQGIARAVDAVRATGAPWPEVIPLVGGGSQDPAFRRLLASATGCALAVVEAPNAAVVGAAMLAMGRVRAPSPPAAVEVIEPDARQAALLGERRLQRSGGLAGEVAS